VQGRGRGRRRLVPEEAAMQNLADHREQLVVRNIQYLIHYAPYVTPPKYFYICTQ
jgi:hypothetical protein